MVGTLLMEWSLTFELTERHLYSWILSSYAILIMHMFPLFSTKIEVNQDNLAYLTALFPESEIVREQLKERRTRLKSFAACSNDTLTLDEDSPQFHSLLSIHVIPTQKLQILFLLTLVRMYVYVCVCVCVCVCVGSLVA